MSIVKKITSRKFLAAVAGVVTGLSMILGLDQNIIATVAGAVTALTSVVTYIVTEGKVDAKAVKTALEATTSAKEAINNDESE